MSQKIILSVFLFLTICIGGYVVFFMKSTPAQQQPITQATSTEYRNTEYGFVVNLPLSWKEYSIINDTWKAYNPNKPQGSVPDETGPLLSIRNPLWTASTTRQDIPIMIFTHAQWDLLTQDKIHIGAAPINPSELSRNANYVFALPARYNYAFPLGYEEVEDIMKTKPLRGF